MIIIKSQDSKILKVEAVVIDSQECRSIGGIVSSGAYYILGSYESEERAKEVMEMIEKHIGVNHVNEMICKISNVNYPNATFTDLYDFFEKHKQDAIFTMPKE